LWFHGILARDANHTYLRNTRVFLNTHAARLTLRRQPLLAALVSDHRFDGSAEVPSSRGASPAVSRVSKLPTWTRDRAATSLAGSSDADGGSVVSGPCEGVTLGRMTVLVVAKPCWVMVGQR